MGVLVVGRLLVGDLRTFPLRKCALNFFQRLILLSAHADWFWQRNVTYAVQLEAERGRGPI
jgi:hypothetical protein